MTSRHCHTIVVGLGAVGAAVVYQLASMGVDVIGIDRLSPPHVFGSTHGESRITRQAIGEGKAYTPLALRSNEIWGEMERLSGESLLTRNGALIISKSGGTSSLHGKSDFLAQTIASAQEYSIAHEVLDADDIRSRFPQFLVSDDDIAYYEPGSGFLRPERCVRVALNLAKGLGANIRIEQQVLEIEDADHFAVVRMDDDSISADHLIIAAGAWVSRFLSPGYRSLFKVYRQVQFWFETDSTADFDPAVCPVFIWDFGSGGGMYGFPMLDGSGSIKVAAEQYDVTTLPDSLDKTVSEEEASNMYRDRVDGRLAGVTDRLQRTDTCLYTVTSDSGFVIDKLPGSEHIIVASPCSGHGFKHSAAIGEALAQICVSGKSVADISSFSLDRFSVDSRL